MSVAEETCPYPSADEMEAALLAAELEVAELAGAAR
jgi:hypothetical protein